MQSVFMELSSAAAVDEIRLEQTAAANHQLTCVACLTSPIDRTVAARDIEPLVVVRIRVIRASVSCNRVPGMSSILE